MTSFFQPPHIYDNRALDRASLKRQDQAFLHRMRNDPLSLVVVMNGMCVRVERQTPPIIARVTAGMLPRQLKDDDAFLGLLGERAVFLIQLDEDDPDSFHELPGEDVELRQVGRFMSRDEASILALARALMNWHKTHRYCGGCGAPMRVTQGGHARHCDPCSRDVFPRTDPAVIVLVLHEDYCLLGRAARFPGNMYSTLAGFVEAGESLEHCLRREIFEEAGVRLKSWQYRSSQPWPFPQSLMLGFWAWAEERSLVIDQDELEDARWFSKSELIDPANRPVTLPTEDSIARALIEDWLHG